MIPSALDAFRFLANMNDLLTSHARDLGTHNSVSEVVFSMECKNYVSPGLLISLWSEVKLRDSRVITLWVDLEPDGEEWLVDGRLSWFGDETIHQRETARLSSFNQVQSYTAELIKDLQGRVTELVKIVSSRA